MCYPDLNVEVVSSGIVARLPLERHELCKAFPCCFEGIYELGRWMDDLGMKMCCVRIVSHDHAMLDMVVKVAEQLGMGGHTVSFTGIKECRMDCKRPEAWSAMPEPVWSLHLVLS